MCHNWRLYYINVYYYCKLFIAKSKRYAYTNRMIHTDTQWLNIDMYWGDYTLFFIMLGVAFLIGFTPLSAPFKWLETLYHELSHALIIKLTGGHLGQLVLQWNGGGHITSRGGMSIPVLLAGYMGAAAIGGYLYYAGWLIDNAHAARLLTLQLGVLVITVLWLVRSVITLLICCIIGAIFYLPIQFPQFEFFPLLIQFMGLYVLLNAIRAPLHLIDGKLVGDGAMLQQRTFIPELIWVALWFLWGICVLLYVMHLTLPHFPNIIDMFPFYK